MISQDDLLRISLSRFKEAKILLEKNRFDGAVYLCGYALELLLKRHICTVLNWDDGYPSTSKEFDKLKLKSFKTHDLNCLLKLSGLEKQVRADSALFADWQIANTWDSEIRYRNIGSVNKTEAESTINASRTLLNYINGLSKWYDFPAW